MHTGNVAPWLQPTAASAEEQILSNVWFRASFMSFCRVYISLLTCSFLQLTFKSTSQSHISCSHYGVSYLFGGKGLVLGHRLKSTKYFARRWMVPWCDLTCSEPSVAACWVPGSRDAGDVSRRQVEIWPSVGGVGNLRHSSLGFGCWKCRLYGCLDHSKTKFSSNCISLCHFRCSCCGQRASKSQSSKLYPFLELCGDLDLRSAFRS